MEQLVNFIIRPPRAEYEPTEDLLDDEFMLRGKWYRRNDLEIKNSRDHVLQCSHYFPIVSPEGKPLPCVIYCHGNSGCRVDGSEAAIMLLPSNITVFTLDFSGSGLSGGEHVSLGWHEKDDLRAVVDHLRADPNVSLIGLWGRSMGAVTSLLYGADDPSIAAMVLDSPFSDLFDLMMEQVDNYKIRLPKFTVKFAIHYIRRVVQKKAKFDIMDLNTLKVAKACFVPLLLGHAIDDDFIRPHHSDHIFEVYTGDKNIIRFDGDHNSPRPKFYFDSVNIFFRNLLQPPEDELRGTLFSKIPGYVGKGLLGTLPEEGYDRIFSSAPKGGSTSMTSVAVEQVHSRGSISLTEVPSNWRWELQSGDLSRYFRTCLDQSDLKVGEDHSLSPSNMISFELSNDHSFGAHLPTCLDDNQYVEYQLDDLSGFPSSTEEEDRMLMEAVLESLKDLEMRCTQANQPSTKDNRSMEPLENDRQDNASMENCTPHSAESSSFSSSSSSFSSSSSSLSSSSSSKVEHPVQLKAESILAASETSDPMSSIGVQTLASEHPSQELNVSSTRVTTDACAADIDCSRTSCEHPKSMENLSDTDVSYTTKATMIVERNPASCLMDGLLCRWDRHLFRNSDNR